MISIKRLSGTGVWGLETTGGDGMDKPISTRKGGRLHHWLLGDFTSPSLSFPIWKSGLIITIRIQCGDVHTNSA